MARMHRWPLLLLPALALLPATAPAQMFKDTALQTLYQADKPDALRRAAAARLAQQPDDAQAVLGVAVAALDGGDRAQRTHALQVAQGCAEKLPRSAPCQFALGALLGTTAMEEGLLAAARSLGPVKAALSAAHEAEPVWWPARSALVQFHLEVPGLMGGSRAKAEEMARSAPTPEQQAVLQARLALSDKRFEAALRPLLTLPAMLDSSLLEDMVAWGSQAALGLVNAKEPAKAQPWFEKVVREHPGLATGPYGLARVRGEMGDWLEAARLLEQAQTLKGATNWPVLYRLGIAQQQLGRNEAAKAALQAFVAAGKGQKASLEDARKRLAQLGAL